MFFNSKLPLKRKLIVYGVFGVGVFVIISAVLNKYYSFSQPFGSSWTYWYVRESSTAMIVANVPYTWTLLRRIFNLRAFHIEESSHDRPVPFHSSRSAQGRRAARHSHSNSHSSSQNDSAHRSSVLGHKAKPNDSQSSQSGRASCCIDPKESSPRQPSSGISIQDFEAGGKQHSPNSPFLPQFVPINTPKRTELPQSPRRPTVRIEDWDPDDEYGSPVDLPGRALYYESARNSVSYVPGEAQEMGSPRNV